MQFFPAIGITNKLEEKTIFLQKNKDHLVIIRITYAMKQ
jgi:hypothetical protein